MSICLISLIKGQNIFCHRISFNIITHQKIWRDQWWVEEWHCSDASLSQININFYSLSRKCVHLERVTPDCSRPSLWRKCLGNFFPIFYLKDLGNPVCSTGCQVFLSLSKTGNKTVLHQGQRKQESKLMFAHGLCSQVSCTPIKRII